MQRTDNKQGSDLKKVYSFTMTDRFDYPMDWIMEQALTSAQRGGDVMHFRADKVVYSYSSPNTSK